MIQWIQAHPFLCVAAIYGALICLCLFLFWRRASTRTGLEPEAVEDRVSLMASLMSLGVVKRLDMRPRFIPKAHDPVRSELMAAQILSDQAGAHEAAGRTTRRPAPGERGYQEPVRTIRVTVGHWSILLRRGNRTRIQDTSRPGVDAPAYPVPEEWNDLVTALAFEVQRLREGWDVTKP